MLSSEAAGFAVRIAKGLIDLTRRIDLVLAEKAAVEAPLALPLPQVALEPTTAQMRKALRELVAETKEDVPDPLGADRQRIVEAVEAGEAAELWRLLRKHRPERALARMLDVDGAFVELLRAERPELAADPDLVAAAFFVGPGADERRTGYVWRVALTVVDVLAELGADTGALFVRDPRLRDLATSVLRRFGEADLQTLDGTQEILRAALSATLAGALDARGSLALDERWVGALLDALADLRASLPADERDDFLLGLLRGRGLPGLVAAFLEVGARQLDDDQVEDLRDVAADLLRELAGLVAEEPSFAGFFQEHWGELLRAGLASLERHGPGLLAGEDPLLGEVLVALLGELSERSETKLLSSETLVALADAAIAVVAAHPERLDEELDAPWLATLVRSVAGVVADRGLRESFGRAGLEALAREALGAFAEHPELLAGDGELARELLAGTLAALAEVETFAAEELARAALGGALETLARHPELLELEYPELVAALAAKVGALVRARRLGKLQAGELLAALVSAVAENPRLFLELEDELAGEVLEAVLSVVEEDEARLLAGAALVQTAVEVVRALARSGQAALAGQPAGELIARLGELLGAGLERAAKELGHRVSLGALPRVLGELVALWARGELATLDPENPNFKRAFAELAARAA